nr:reverse transcriptase domain-containing protein [Tanacetum cinerariifolium]
MPSECLKIIESKFKVRQSRAKAVVAKDMVRALLLDKKNKSSAPAHSPTPAPVKAAPIPQAQSVSTTDFESYVKANDAVLRNMQNQGQNLQIQMANLIDMLSKFVSSNTASSSGSGTLPSNTITNPKEDLKVVAPVSTPMPNLKPYIPYPSKRDNKRRRDQANEQIKKFYKIFKDMSFEISFTDALILMPKFASTLKDLIGNKEKLSEMARTPMNEHCSAVILNKLPRKLGDPDKFLIPCEFPGIDECLALADLEVLSFFDVTASGNPTPYDDSIVSTTSPTLTSFGDSDFLLFEEADAFLSLDDDPNSPKFNPFYYDPKGEILLLEAILNSEPLPPIPNHEHYMPSFKKELKVCEAKIVKSFVDEPPMVELKDSPPHFEYAFLEGDNKFPIIITKELGDEKKSTLIKVLKSHKRAIAWKLSDIQGIILEFCTHKILMKEDYKPTVQHQGRVNPKIYDVIKKEVEKLIDAGLIYPISDSPWVSRVHCVPKKGGFTVVENEENELIPTRLVTRWRVCIDYRQLNEATRKDYFPLMFMDQMLERLAGNEYYCFLDGFSGYFQIPIDTRDQEKTTFTCPYGMFAYRRMPFGLCNAPGTFQRCMLAIFHNMVEKTMEVFMDDFLVFGDSFENCLSRLDQMLQSKEALDILKACHNGPTGGHHGANLTAKKVEAKALPTNDARVVCMFLKSLFARFGAPRAIISDRGTHFCNDQFAKVMLKYEVTHRLSTAYHPQTSGQVEVSNRGLKRILERTIGENRASWSDILDDALWAFRTAYKTPIGCTPYKLVYGKAFHLPIELEHKAYWALKQVNFDLAIVGDHRKVQLNELNELCDHAYENSLIYKEKMKRIHDSKIKNRVFNVGDRVLLFNSRLTIFSSKLKTSWSGPFTITKVFPYGTVELSQANRPNFKVNGHRVKHYFGGDVPQLDCLDCDDSRALSFYPSFTRASHPQLHFGNPDILILSTNETDTQEKEKNKSKNDKTEHGMEKLEKDKVIRSQKSKVKARCTLDWNNPKGDQYPFDMSKPLPLQGHPERTYTTSITKTKAAQYEIEGIEDMVPTLWSPTKKILGVKSVSVKKLHGYGHLKEIVMKRADRQFYMFKEGDLMDLHLNDIEDMLLLDIKHKLIHLTDNDIVDFIVVLRMFTRSLVIKKHVKDLQLGVESYQKKLNITPPQQTFPESEFKELYTPSHNPPGVIYKDLTKQKRVMRADELYKFSDGTLKKVRDELHHRIRYFRLEYNTEMSKRKWMAIDRKRSELMVELIDKQMCERRIIRNLERLVGARELEMDYKLMMRTT